MKDKWLIINEDDFNSYRIGVVEEVIQGAALVRLQPTVGLEYSLLISLEMLIDHPMFIFDSLTDLQAWLADMEKDDRPKIVSMKRER